MKLLLALCFALATFSSSAQCISIKEMRAFAKKDLSQREEFMELRGYTYKGTVEDILVSGQWVKSEEIKFTCYAELSEINEKSVVVMNQMGASITCAKNIKNEITLLRLHKDAEYYKDSKDEVDGQNKFLRYYSGGNYGICLCKTSWPDGYYVYTITLYTNMVLYRDCITNKV